MRIRRIPRKHLYQVIKTQQAKLNELFEALGKLHAERGNLEQRNVELVNMSHTTARRLKMNTEIRMPAWLAACLVTLMLTAVFVTQCSWVEPAAATDRFITQAEKITTEVGQPINPDDPIIRCEGNIPVKSAVKVSEMLLPNGTVAIGYATDRSKVKTRADIIAFHVLLSAEYQPREDAINLRVQKYAIFYHVDLDLDGLLDIVYSDKYAEGLCSDIKPEMTLPGYRGLAPTDETA